MSPSQGQLSSVPRRSLGKEELSCVCFRRTICASVPNNTQDRWAHTQGTVNSYNLSCWLLLAPAGRCHYWKWTLLLAAESPMLSWLSQAADTQFFKVILSFNWHSQAYNAKVPCPRSVQPTLKICHKWVSLTNRVDCKESMPCTISATMMNPTPFSPVYVWW